MLVDEAKNNNYSFEKLCFGFNEKMINELCNDNTR